MEPAYTALTAGINTSSSSTDPAPATKSALQASSDALAQINRVYLGAASVRRNAAALVRQWWSDPIISVRLQLHIANAFMYIWVWWPLGYRWDDWISEAPFDNDLLILRQAYPSPPVPSPVIPEYLNVIGKKRCINSRYR